MMLSGAKRRRRKLAKTRLCLALVGALIGVDVVLQAYLSLRAGEEAIAMHGVGGIKVRHKRRDLASGAPTVRIKGPDDSFESARDMPFKDDELQPGLVLTAVSRESYEVRLSRKPRHEVAVTVSDEQGCFEVLEPSGIVFAPDDWNEGRMVMLRPFENSKQHRGCVRGRVLHELFSTDLRFDGIFVRTAPLYAFRLQDPAPFARPFETTPLPALAPTNPPHVTQPLLRRDAPAAERATPAPGPRAPDVAAAAEEPDAPPQPWLPPQPLSTQEGDEPGSAEAEVQDAAPEKQQEAQPQPPAADEQATSPSKGSDSIAPADLEPPKIIARSFPALKNLTSDVSMLMTDYNCAPSKMPNKAIRCMLAEDTDYATAFYVISAPKLQNKLHKKAPVVMVVGGVHGKEVAGFEAAGIIKTWTPRSGRFIVIDRLNRRGIERHTRYVPPVQAKDHEHAQPHGGARHLAHQSGHVAGEAPPGHHDDLNRDFPADVDEAPAMPLAQAVWDLCTKVRPKLFLDLHEGWGFYAQLKQNDEPRPDHLVSNPKFSKGSSVIATPNALHMAKLMVDIVNGHIKDHKHRFEVLSPPIAGGLARRLHNAFDTQAFVLETTQLNQAPEKRVSQHLRMVAGLLSRLGFLHKDFRVSKVKLARKPGAQTSKPPHGTPAAFAGAALAVPSDPEQL